MVSLGKMSRPGEVYLALSELVRGMQPGAKMPSYKDLRQRWKVPQRSLDIAYGITLREKRCAKRDAASQ